MRLVSLTYRGNNTLKYYLLLTKGISQILPKKPSPAYSSFQLSSAIVTLVQHYTCCNDYKTNSLRTIKNNMSNPNCKKKKM